MTDERIRALERRPIDELDAREFREVRLHHDATGRTDARASFARAIFAVGVERLLRRIVDETDCQSWDDLWAILPHDDQRRAVGHFLGVWRVRVPTFDRDGRRSMEWISTVSTREFEALRVYVVMVEAAKKVAPELVPYVVDFRQSGDPVRVPVRSRFDRARAVRAGKLPPALPIDDPEPTSTLYAPSMFRSRVSFGGGPLPDPGPIRMEVLR